MRTSPKGSLASGGRAIIPVMRVIVVGGGIGGLTAAIALRRVGIDVDIYEQAADLREVGAGIGLAANALRALEALELGDELRSECLAAAQGGLRRPDGEFLVSIAVDELSQKFGSVAVVHRAELLALLRRHVEPSRVHVEHRCIEVGQASNSATARFDTGDTVRADAIIAADGLRSTIRAQLFGNPVIRYAGYTAWRAVVNGEVEQYGEAIAEKVRSVYLTTVNLVGPGPLHGRLRVRPYSSSAVRPAA